MIALALLRHCVLAMSSSKGRGDALCCLYDPLQVLSVRHFTVGIPGRNAVCQGTLNGAAVC